MSTVANVLCFGCFAAGRLVNGDFPNIDVYIFIGLHRSLKNIIDLLSRAQSRLQHLGKSVTVFSFLWFSSSFFVCVRHNYLSNLAAISLQVGVNNSLIFLSLQTFGLHRSLKNMIDLLPHA